MKSWLPRLTGTTLFRVAWFCRVPCELGSGEQRSSEPLRNDGVGRTITFEQVCSNVLGYARGRSIAISPLNALKHKTRFHELAHVVLGHTAEGQKSDTEVTPRDIREAEAEGVAYLLCALLDLPG